MCKSSVYLLADDTKISKDICSLSDSSDLQYDIDSLLCLCTQWNMFLHSGKCVTVHFSHSANHSLSYPMNNTPIQSSIKYRDLGIILSNNLSLSNHYNHINRSAYHSLHLICHSFSSTLPVNLKKTSLPIIGSLSPNLYCSQIWRPRLPERHRFHRTYPALCN